MDTTAAPAATLLGLNRLWGLELSRADLAQLGLRLGADVPVFVFDEPSASLDPIATRILIARARELRVEGRTILYSTHVAADIDQLATRVALLRHGFGGHPLHEAGYRPHPAQSREPAL